MFLFILSRGGRCAFLETLGDEEEVGQDRLYEGGKMVNGADAEGGSGFTWSKGPNRIVAGGATPRWVMARDGAATITVERGVASRAH